MAVSALRPGEAEAEMPGGARAWEEVCFVPPAAVPAAYECGVSVAGARLYRGEHAIRASPGEKDSGERIRKRGKSLQKYGGCMGTAGLQGWGGDLLATWRGREGDG